MKIKKEYIILAAVIVALSLYLMLRKTDRSLYELPKLAAVKAADISKIEIGTSNGILVLVKKADGWVVGDRQYRADADKVKGLTDILSKLTLTTLISESKNYQRYGLDEDKKIAVKAWTGDKLCREFDLGKATTSSSHTFVKIAGNHRVYHARQNFRKQFELTLDALRHKTVFTVEKEKITRITLAKGDVTAVFEKETAKSQTGGNKTDGKEVIAPETVIWKSAGGKVAKTNKIDQLLSSMQKLKCESFIEGKEKADFKDPIYTITLEDTAEHVLKIFEKQNKQDRQYPAVSSKSDFAFRLPHWWVKRFMIDPDSLIEKDK
jgi:ketosteroid isomerase-like protein